MTMAELAAQLHESHLRSIIKAMSWRMIATCTTAAIAYLVTGRIGIALTIGGMELFVKILAYYLHERAWQMVPIGTIRSVFQR
jgi:uncharacterized membrane protein